MARKVDRAFGVRLIGSTCTVLASGVSRARIHSLLEAEPTPLGRPRPVNLCESRAMTEVVRGLDPGERIKMFGAYFRVSRRTGQRSGCGSQEAEPGPERSNRGRAAVRATGDHPRTRLLHSSVPRPKHRGSSPPLTTVRLLEMRTTLPAELITHILELVVAEEEASIVQPATIGVIRPPFLWTISFLSSAWRNFALPRLVKDVSFAVGHWAPGNFWCRPSEKVFRLVQTLVSRPGVAKAIKTLSIEGTPVDGQESLELLLLCCTGLERLTIGDNEGMNLDVVKAAARKWMASFGNLAYPVQQLTRPSMVNPAFGTLLVYGTESWYTPPLALNIRSLVVSESSFSPALSPTSLPRLEVLVLRGYETTKSCDRLANASTLRALVLSTSRYPARADPSFIGPTSILWDITDWGRMHKFNFSLPPQPLIHIRCSSAYQAGELVNALGEDWSIFDDLRSIFDDLQTVYLVTESRMNEEWNWSDAQLREIGREKGFEVAYEPKPAPGGYEFDYFVEKHGKPRVT